jgi:hypothetical protein
VAVKTIRAPLARTLLKSANLAMSDHRVLRLWRADDRHRGLDVFLPEAPDRDHSGPSGDYTA